MYDPPCRLLSITSNYRSIWVEIDSTVNFVNGARSFKKSEETEEENFMKEYIDCRKQCFYKTILNQKQKCKIHLTIYYRSRNLFVNLLLVLHFRRSSGFVARKIPKTGVYRGL